MNYTASCAVCGGPGEPECPCEGQKLQQCIEQAEKAWIESWVGKTREWATNNAINAITTLFNKKKEARMNQFRAQIQGIPYYPLYQQYRGQPPLDPQIIRHIHLALREADLRLKQGIDYDWKQCVVRYPDVLAHFYNQIKIPLPTSPDAPFQQALAGGGAQRPPSVVNMPPQRELQQHPHHQERTAPPSTIGMGINRSATAPPKKARRSSKVNMERELDGDVMALLTQQLEGLGRNPSGHAGRTKAATPAPQASSAAAARRQPIQKKRESRDFAGGHGLPRQLNAPPHVPQPPGGFNMGGLRGSIYGDFQ